MKVHYFVNAQFENGLACGRCDIARRSRTGNPEKVTCKTCLRVMARETGKALGEGCHHILPPYDGVSTLQMFTSTSTGQTKFFCRICRQVRRPA